MSYPEMMAVPLVGEASPVSILNVVVLPAPTNRATGAMYRLYNMSCLFHTQ